MAIRFRVNPKKTATLSGVDYADLRSIFAAAQVNFYQDAEKLRSKKRLSSQDRENLAWVKSQISLLEAINLATEQGLSATFPTRPTPPPTKAQRLAAVTAERRERIFLDNLFQEAIGATK